jgi:alpha-L-arabinofuranosidase
LTASSPSDTNSLEDSRRIVPRTERAGNLGSSFTREFSPYSITVLKLKTN